MKVIAHILIFYFSLGACLPKCDFSQLLKLNELQEHFESHQKEAAAIGQTISFSDFLFIHFIDRTEHQHDHENNHENLPLQNITSTTVLCVKLPQELIILKNAFSEATLPTYNSAFQMSITFDIFHPPRIA